MIQIGILQIEETKGTISECQDNGVNGFSFSERLRRYSETCRLTGAKVVSNLLQSAKSSLPSPEQAQQRKQSS
jgi:hypothetical protein